jgi:hypothetical protein
MRIGLDFDNTIVCYGKAMALLSEEFFELPKGLPRTKLALREFLRVAGREQDWTAFQGELYGPGMRYAEPFEGAVSAMHALKDEGHELAIISHRTRHPYIGKPHNLHQAALQWIDKHLRSANLFNASSSEINFMETCIEKLERIAELECDIFLDDLPEVLNADSFPRDTKGILFDPSGEADTVIGRRKIRIWTDFPGLIATIGNGI